MYIELYIILFTIIIPMQLWLLSLFWYPSSQSHLKLPCVLMHVPLSQRELSSLHSFTSGVDKTIIRAGSNLGWLGELMISDFSTYNTLAGNCKLCEDFKAKHFEQLYIIVVILGFWH